MTVNELLARFHEVAGNPKAQLDAYLKAGKKVILVAPVYTPEELVHAMGFVPMGAWGADVELKEAKEYCPAFICSILQSLLQLGIKGTYEGASAIIIPNLCDSLRGIGQNWKYAVPSIPFIPMTYPQHRKPAYGAAFTKAGYERVIADLEKATGVKFDESKLENSIKVYNAHNAAMRELAVVLADHAEILPSQRSDIFKSATFMLKEEHTALVNEFIEALKGQEAKEDRIRIMTTGILADAPGLNSILDEMNMHIVADDIAAQSRQYRTDAPAEFSAMDSLVKKFQNMGNCSVLYDFNKDRVDYIVEQIKEYDAKGLLIIMTKFCDPEEFDYPLIKKACEEAGIPTATIEVDRQMVDYEQARTAIETFRDLLA